MSREALRKFVEEAIPNPKKCRQDSGGAEDVEIGKCKQDFFIIEKLHIVLMMQARNLQDKRIYLSDLQCMIHRCAVDPCILVLIAVTCT